MPTSNKGLEPKNESEARLLAEQLSVLQKDAQAAMSQVIAMGEFERTREQILADPIDTSSSSKQVVLDVRLLSPSVISLRGKFPDQRSGVTSKNVPAHGYTGWTIDTLGIDGFSASNTANTSVDMPTDPYIFGTRTIYAPTTKTRNSCVEVLTATVKQNYFWIPALYHEFWVWNWCSGNSTGQKAYVRTIDANFINNYMRLLPQSASPEPEYIYITQKQPDGKWHVFLYNFNTNMYDDVYNSSGTTPDPSGTGGWTIFEMYVYGACPFYLPTIYNEVVKVRLNGTWRNLTLADGAPFNSSADCSENGFYGHLIKSTKHPVLSPFSAAQNLSPSSTVQNSVSILSISGRTVTLKIAVSSLGAKNGTTTLATGSINWGDSVVEPFYPNQVGDWIYLSHTYPVANTWHISSHFYDNLGAGSGSSVDVTVI